MPELPEVETVRRHLSPVLVGRAIIDVDVRRDRMVRRNVRPTDLADRVLGRRIVDVGRHGKFLILSLTDDVRLVLHLGMSGRIRLLRVGDPEVSHTNVVITLEDDVAMHFVDPRTFGFIAAWTDDDLNTSSLSRLGPDAWDAPPSPIELGKRLAGRRLPIKAALLDQRIVAGIGNIYADEILFRSGVHPQRTAGSLTTVEVDRLAMAIHPVLEAGIAAGGTSLDDLAYLLPDDRAGAYQSRLAVYGREDKACQECGTMIQRVVVAQRSSHFCPICQPASEQPASGQPVSEQHVREQPFGKVPP